jgi:glutamate racemase
VIGLYDSGLGGLTVLAALRDAGVDADVVYFADQAHVPYGDRNDAELQSFLIENFALLETSGVDAIVMACNTSCAVASRNGGFPATAFPVLDVIENAGKSFKNSAFSRVAVFATAATVRSGAYKREIQKNASGIEVVEIAAAALVPIVETGNAGTSLAQQAVHALCENLPPGIDAVVYGCTHYPMLDAEFRAALGSHVAIIDPAQAQAQATVALLAAGRIAHGSSVTRYLTNGDLAAFETNVRKWTGDTAGTVTRAAALAR